MKKLFFNSMWILLFTALTTFSFQSCDEGEDIDDEIFLDGYYVSGEATPLAKLDVRGKMTATVNEIDQTARTGFNEIYMALEGGKTFTITEVAGATKTAYGPGTGFGPVEQVAANDEMGATVYLGKYKAGGTFSVSQSGLYHIVLDKETSSVAILPVKYWAIIGGATPLGWSDNKMDMIGSFAKDTMSFQITKIALVQGDYKFRYSGAWKQTISAEPLVKVNTNFGGTLEALAPGGANIAFLKANQGEYTVTGTWGINTGMKFNMVKTGEVVVAEYPDNLYLIGDGIGGWEWTGNYIITMKPVHSHPNAFWTIAYINAGGVKFSPVKEWKGDFGVTGTATNGVYGKGGDNISISTAGYYMLYVDLKAEKISVTAPEVYLIGSALNGVWDYAAAAGKFTVDNTTKKITSPACTAGELRMYATCPLSQLDTPKADWWQMEFMVLSGKIEYRGKGDDQARVNVTAGQKVALDFVAGTGTIQ